MYQDTICIQPIIIASRRHPKLIDMEDQDDDTPKPENQNQPNIQINFQNLEYGKIP